MCKPTTTWDAQHKTAIFYNAGNGTQTQQIWLPRTHWEAVLKGLLQEKFKWFLRVSRTVLTFNCCWVWILPTPDVRTQCLWVLPVTLCLTGDSAPREVGAPLILNEFILSRNSESLRYLNLLLRVHKFRFWNTAHGRSDNKSNRKMDISLRDSCCRAAYSK